MSETIRTRFAPSPTGDLHIGGVRTAIFNWLYARRFGGQFILRIEDTDHERSTEDSIAQIIETMRWLGLDWDEGPYRQTERQDRYREYVDKLIGLGAAYRCVCSKEELDRKREEAQRAGHKPMYDGTCRDRNIPANCGKPFVVRFATPRSGETVIQDLLRGGITFRNEELDDMIILRADGTPTYNFCVVVDDAEMNITHVIRGDDHLANTPRQVVIYDALRLPLPKFAHVSMILGSDGKRLSKRHGALSALEYRDRGYLPGALVNYLARLGWSHGDREVFSPGEMKELFNLESVSKSAARFDEEKLLWTNAEHIKTAPEGMLAELVSGLLLKEGVTASPAEVVPLLPMLRERSRTTLELANGCRYFFSDDLRFDADAVAKFFTPGIAPLLAELADRLGDIEFTHDKIEAVFRALIEEKQVKLKDLAQPARLAVTGGTVSPPLFDVMAALGRARCAGRLRAAAARIAGGN